MNDKKNNISLGTVYDLNKQIMLNQSPLKNAKINRIKPKIEDWFNWRLDGYAMLLCRERYDFTVFHLYEKQNKNPCAIATNELIEALNNRGDILSIEENSNNPNTWEIWMRINDEAFVYYLFPCDDFVIQC